MARPSLVLVPLPSSSIIARLLLSMFLQNVSLMNCCNEKGVYLRMKAVSLISAAKEDTLASIQSSMETRANS